MADDGRLRVLIVDDEPVNVEVLEALFEDYEVEHAYCGREAVEKVDSFGPDLILLDVLMPRLDGYEVCRHIRVHQRVSGSIVVFLSAKAAQDDIDTGYEVGADDYLTKPFDHATLLAKIETQLRARGFEGLTPSARVHAG